MKVDTNILFFLQKKLGYQFCNISLLIEAITHPSCILEGCARNYERLEFLGDAVLNLIIAKILFDKYKNLHEDSLSTMRARLVSCEALCFVANSIDLKGALILSTGEENNGGRLNLGNIENSMEAVIAAIYLDSSIKKIEEIIYKLWNEIIENPNKLSIDSKTLLQEWAQKNKYNLPIYILINTAGPSHAPVFEIKVEIEEYYAIASGVNKKAAEKAASLEFLNKYQIIKKIR